MTTGVACPPVILQFTLNNGQLAAGGSVLTQVGGTNAATYQDVGLTTPLPNPIPLNSRGEISNASGASCQLFLTPNTVYTFTISDANGNQIWVATYVNGVQVSITQAIVGAALYPPLTATGQIENGVSVVNAFYNYGVVDRYGTNTTPGTTDMTAAISSANTVWTQGGPAISFLNETYATASSLTINAPCQFGANALLKPATATTITLNGPVCTPAGPTKIFSLASNGGLAYTAVPTGGSSYTNGTYTAVPLTGGSGTGAQASIVVSGGAVTSVSITANGTGYQVGDTVSASAANIGGTGSGFTNTVTAVAQILGSVGNVDLYTRWYGDVADGNFSAGTGTDNQPAFSQALGTAMARAELFTASPNRLLTEAGAYRCNSQLQVGDGITWQGIGKYGTILFVPSSFTNTGGLIAINGKGGQPTNFRGFAILTQVGGAGGQGIVSTKNATFISDVWVSGFISHAGIVLSSTDNFLSDFACELNQFGIQITASDVTVQQGTLYQNTVNGIVVDNTGGVGNTDSGRVTVVNVRDFGAGQVGFIVTSGQRVTFNACHVCSNINSNYNVAGFQIAAATDVVLDGCSATIATGASTAPACLISASCADIVVNGFKEQGWYDGLQAVSPNYLNVTGGSFVGNSRNGLLLNGGIATVTGVQSRNNTAAGIDSENTTAAGYHLIGNNQCLANNTYGLVFNLTGTGAFTNVQGNQSRGNTTNGYSFAGTVANILVGSALAASAGAAATAGTNY